MKNSLESQPDAPAPRTRLVADAVVALAAGAISMVAATSNPAPWPVLISAVIIAAPLARRRLPVATVLALFVALVQCTPSGSDTCRHRGGLPGLLHHLA